MLMFRFKCFGVGLGPEQERDIFECGQYLRKLRRFT
jgi:hypothetical protein